MAPELLYRSIREGKMKFTYRTEQLNESGIIRYIREGTLNTERNKIRIVEPSVFKKIRTGLQKGTPPEASQKQKGIHLNNGLELSSQSAT